MTLQPHRLAVVFDLDGTLHNRQLSVEINVREQHRRLLALHQVSEETYCRRFLELDRRGYEPKESVYRQLAEELALAIPWEDLTEDYLAEYQRFAMPMDGMRETLHALRAEGHPMALVTNGSSRMQRGKILALEIESSFDVVLISGEIGMKKPDPAIYRLCLDRLGSQPRNAVFVGDHPTLDVAGPQAIGMKGIWFEDMYWRECPHADASVRHLNELPSAIRALG